MRIDPRLARDGAHHTYCLNCRAEAVDWTTSDGRRTCVCRACGRRADRALVIDPAISWWLDDDGEYWHESAGVFVRDARHRFLFFERTAFPFALTVPAGHVDRGEGPREAAARELGEEVGIFGGDLVHVASDPLDGDVCRRGSDAHVWHAYLLNVPHPPEVSLNQEGHAPVWLTAGEALTRRLTFAVRRMLEQHAAELTAPGARDAGADRGAGARPGAAAGPGTSTGTAPGAEAGPGAGAA